MKYPQRLKWEAVPDLIVPLDPQYNKTSADTESISSFCNCFTNSNDDYSPKTFLTRARNGCIFLDGVQTSCTRPLTVSLIKYKIILFFHKTRKVGGCKKVEKHRFSPPVPLKWHTSRNLRWRKNSWFDTLYNSNQVKSKCVFICKRYVS